MKVFTYWNLHKGQWSVKDITPGSPSYGRVVARLDSLLIENAVGKVSEAGRQRVLREGRKNVHAGIVGTWCGWGRECSLGGMIEEIGDRITYNPYKYETFVHAVDESQFEGAAYALLTADRAVFVA